MLGVNLIIQNVFIPFFSIVVKLFLRCTFVQYFIGRVKNKKSA